MAIKKASRVIKTAARQIKELTKHMAQEIGLRSVTTPSPKAIMREEKIQKRVSCMGENSWFKCGEAVNSQKFEKRTIASSKKVD